MLTSLSVRIADLWPSSSRKDTQLKRKVSVRCQFTSVTLWDSPVCHREVHQCRYRFTVPLLTATSIIWTSNLMIVLGFLLERDLNSYELIRVRQKRKLQLTSSQRTLTICLPEPVFHSPRGPFLESPGTFSGLELYFKIKNYKMVV